MTELVSWIATVLVIALLLAFGAALISLRALPTVDRPHTPIYDRLGSILGLAENPDYHENPGEENAKADRPGRPQPKHRDAAAARRRPQ